MTVARLCSSYMRAHFAYVPRVRACMPCVVVRECLCECVRCAPCRQTCSADGVPTVCRRYADHSIWCAHWQRRHPTRDSATASRIRRGTACTSCPRVGTERESERKDRERERESWREGEFVRRYIGAGATLMSPHAPRHYRRDIARSLAECCYMRLAARVTVEGSCVHGCGN